MLPSAQHCSPGSTPTAVATCHAASCCPGPSRLVLGQSPDSGWAGQSTSLGSLGLRPGEKRQPLCGGQRRKAEHSGASSHVFTSTCNKPVRDQRQTFLQTFGLGSWCFPVGVGNGGPTTLGFHDGPGLGEPAAPATESRLSRVCPRGWQAPHPHPANSPRRAIRSGPGEHPLPS